MARTSRALRTVSNGKRVFKFTDVHNLYSDAKHPEVDGPVVQQAVRTQPGPSVFGPLQLLGLVVIFAGQYGELSALRTNLAGEEAAKGMVETGRVEQ